MQYLLKILLSSLLLVTASEVGKRNSLVGGLIISLPLVSIMSLIWLYLDTKNTASVAELSLSIFWMVLPSLSFFLALTYLLKRELPFIATLLISSTIAIIAYKAAFKIYKLLGIHP